MTIILGHDLQVHRAHIQQREMGEVAYSSQAPCPSAPNICSVRFRTLAGAVNWRRKASNSRMAASMRAMIGRGSVREGIVDILSAPVSRWSYYSRKPRLVKRACEGTAQRAASRSDLEGGLPDDRAGAGFTGGQSVGMQVLTATGGALYYLHAVIWTARRQQPKAAATSPSGVQKLP